jgi:uncharacterized protein YcgI (DUF1989 family)
MTATAIRIQESALDPAKAMYSATLPAGEPWLHEVKQGQTLRIVDLEGNQAADISSTTATTPTSTTASPTPSCTRAAST